MNPKVSCVLCTYGRFETVRRSITFWKYQDYDNKELIIFNTAPVPIVLDDSLQDHDIRVINQQHVDGNAFSSLGQVRETALQFVTGDIYVCWDDDDMFLPWHISQGIRELKKCGRAAWMPAQSYFSGDDGQTFQYARNSMEASVLLEMESLRQYGFSYENGLEHLPWRRKMVDTGELVETDEVTPLESYAYIWGSDLAPHKTSGNVDNPDNFENHKEGSTDFGDVPLTFVDPEQVEQLFINVYKFVQDDTLKEEMCKHLKVLQI